MRERIFECFRSHSRLNMIGATEYWIREKEQTAKCENSSRQLRWQQGLQLGEGAYLALQRWIIRTDVNWSKLTVVGIHHGVSNRCTVLKVVIDEEPSTGLVVCCCIRSKTSQTTLIPSIAVEWIGCPISSASWHNSSSNDLLLFFLVQAVLSFWTIVAYTRRSSHCSIALTSNKSIADIDGGIPALDGAVVWGARWLCVVNNSFV